MSPEGKRRKVEDNEPGSAHNETGSAQNESGAAHKSVSTHSQTVSAPKDQIPAFLAWCSSFGIVLNDKVYVSTEGTAAGFGLLARQDLAAGEVVFSVPRLAVLSQHTTRIRALLEEEGRSLESASGWVPLLLALMYEATDARSPWAPYFALWPQLVPPDLPMFWSEEERAELLGGTGVEEAVRRDLVNMEREYETIVRPFIQKHPEHFQPHTHTLTLYKRLVAFVMAYSFQEPVEDEEGDCGKDVLPPMMVPVADLLNHVSRHNTQLEYTEDCLRMVTTRVVLAGHELYNTYGQLGNWQLLHMYGFSEPPPDNVHDNADIPMGALRDAALQGAESEEEKAGLQDRWSLLSRMEVVVEGGAFVFGCEEVLTDEELITCLKLLCMSGEEFAEYEDNDGWEEDEDEDDEGSLTYQKVAALPLSWRRLLHAAADLTMKSYVTPQQCDQRLISDPSEYRKLNRRQTFSLHVRRGQRLILQRLLEATVT